MKQLTRHFVTFHSTRAGFIPLLGRGRAANPVITGASVGSRRAQRVTKQEYFIG